ncbi:MAG: hypothetical protein ACI8QZ_003747 [Chlamydiales bacterium]|jgi:hypothetical protein
MRYLLLIYTEESVDEGLSETEMGQLMEGYGKFGAELAASGAQRDSARLQPIAAATTVRIRNGETVHTDGPFAETKEALGGYYMIDVENLDAALEWARKIPSAHLGSIEVRPIWEME